MIPSGLEMIPVGGQGHNQPPDAIEFSRETLNALGEWLKEHPVVSTEDEARAGKLLVDRAADCLKEMETERKKLVNPLNERVKEINDKYRSPREVLDTILDELKTRIRTYVKQEETKRLLAAEEARKRLEEAERLAREAEKREQAATELAKSGVIDVDIAGATVEANTAFAAFKKSERDAARTEKEINVKVSGGFRRALSFPEKENLVVTNAELAIKTMGVTDKIRDAILSSARDYRRACEELPEGVENQPEG